MVIVRPLRARLRRVALACAAIVLAIAAVGLALACWAGFFARQPISFYAGKARSPLAIVYFSGDMGLRMGIATAVVPAMSRLQIPVLGVNSPSAFATHRTRAEVDALVAGAVRETIARTGAQRIVLMGQSFGADMVGTGVAALPQDLRSRVAAVVLVVPGRDAYFRADPTGFAYRGPADSNMVETAGSVTWTKLICIYGVNEEASLCPALPAHFGQVIGLPGGHFLHHDDKALIVTILSALAPLIPQGATS